ncbi:MAG TPA: hypothetical protein VN436_02930 [Holophaga sp.]|nr:hypothetical protein [Holophaga sp.]
MMKRTLCLLKGVLAALVLSSTLHAWDLTAPERKAISRALTDWGEHLRDEGREAHIPRILTEEFYTNPGKLDVIAFLAWWPTGELVEMRTLLVILSDPGKGYKVVASTVIPRVDPAFAKVWDKDLFLRTREDEEEDIQAAYGEARVYSRWHLVDDRLEQVGAIWLRRNDGFVEFKAP